MLVNLDDFKEIYEIPIFAIPQQTFDIYLNNVNFRIGLRTYLNNETRLTIYENNELIINDAPSTYDMINFCEALNIHKKGAFFFFRNPRKIITENEINYLLFGTDKRLFYGSF